MDWDRLRVFYHVAEAGSFTKAGEQLNLSQSAVSRQISALEDNLSVSLFHRHARGLLVTEQGELLYRTAREVYGKIAMTEARLTDSKQRPDGHLTVTATTGFSIIWLMPRIVDFMDRYPEISITMRIEDGELDLSMREADVGIRLSRPTQPDLVMRPLMKIHFHFYASPHYLKAWGTPKTLEDLEKHRMIMYDNGPLRAVVNPEWFPRAFGDDRPQRHPALTVNSMLGMRRAVESGLGIAILPDYVIEGSDRKVRLDIEAPMPTAEAFFVYAEEQRNSARIKVFRDFLLEQVAATEF
ncbi:MAG: LysR family transcriptional regulator [Alphaproteobacteria bacterium]|jgi:DNA-binding transcriptional LysR family regulator|nr:LysR family transcriptional regulator [Rhodospirillaceae bacterium]MBT6204667.1 LysR family transcriptional regulator [Rhodospirillaceae bacterium]MBT6510379.1 LysR family transcriptional regulator [Rhodospirillaceae bacterium]MBT7614051.1 LysR family transcriptional regulator [Rhodospirillaceae bacterium]MDG2481043.1 LysR family transcriptional regulator [Alphaproteobacteria bacterium]